MQLFSRFCLFDQANAKQLEEYQKQADTAVNIYYLSEDYIASCIEIHLSYASIAV